jgi:hypothetical protein
MKDRIKQLKIQACKWASENAPVSEYENACDQKFAELIVRECLTIIDNNNPCLPGTTIMYSFLQDEYFDKGWQVATETKANQIKRHFGVKE